MIENGDRILIAVSGGKDSLTLLDILAKLFDPSNLTALSIVEGIRGYNRDTELLEARRIAKEHGIEHIIVTLREYLGYGVDDFMDAQRKLGIKSPLSACTFCGIARRRVINAVARELGITKVATGHNLDDELQTYLINILRGDIVRLLQSHPFSTPHSSLLIKRIKPLRYIYEYETTIYAYLRGFRFQDAECPYISQRPTLRAKIRAMLIEVEYRSPGASLRLLEYLDTVLTPLVLDQNRKRVKLPLCVKCGEPTSPGRSVCKFCTLIDLISQAFERKNN